MRGLMSRNGVQVSAIARNGGGGLIYKQTLIGYSEAEGVLTNTGGLAAGPGEIRRTDPGGGALQ